MALDRNLWSLKFGRDASLPVLIRSGSPIGSHDIDVIGNKMYNKLGNSKLDYINVLNDFPWTKNPKASRQDVPYCILNEKRITVNSTVTNLFYSVAATGDSLTSLVRQLESGALFGEVGKTTIESINNVVQNVTNDGNEKDLSETLLGLQDELSNATGAEVFNSSVLKPYQGLYTTEDTGFKYIMPLLSDDMYRNSTIEMGADQNNIAAGTMRQFANLATDLAGLTDVIKPGTYIEESQQFSMKQKGRSVQINFPLLNTGTYEDIVTNWQFLFGLIYQNRPGRVTKSIVDIPVIYEFRYPGVTYMPYAYIENLSVSFLGNRRTMRMKVPVSRSVNFSTDRGIQQNDILTAVPDAYQVNITMRALNDESRNFMYESINPGVIVASTKGNANPFRSIVDDFKDNVSEIKNAGKKMASDYISDIKNSIGLDGNSRN